MLEIVEIIEEFRPNVVWVGLGTPKQDLVAQELCHLINVPLVCVGAAFDFVSGGKKTAPVWMQQFGFEWLFRLASEPQRLWKRYLLGNLKFVLLAAKDLWVK
jgi:N-acetylglucosaminyldiphosphoundecaprenol N-acetyl-beta-D-mannosaminyltransferase